MSHPDLREEENKDKRVEFYAAFLNAWIENRMEMDRQIVTLSTAALGVLGFFYDRLKTPTELLIWIASGTSFLAAILFILSVFRDNSKYIECIIREDDDKLQNDIERKLQKQTASAFSCFCVGLIIAFALAIVKTGFNLVKEA